MRKCLEKKVGIKKLRDVWWLILMKGTKGMKIESKISLINKKKRAFLQYSMRSQLEKVNLQELWHWIHTHKLTNHVMYSKTSTDSPESYFQLSDLFERNSFEKDFHYWNERSFHIMFDFTKW